MPSIALQDHTVLSSAFFNHNPLPTLVIKASTLQIAAANKMAASVLQYSTTALQNFTLPDLLEPGDRLAFNDLWKQHKVGAWSHIFKFIKSDDSIIEFNWFFSSFTHAGQQYCQMAAIPVSRVHQDSGQCQVPNCVTCKIKLMASLVNETEDILNASDLLFKPVSWNAAAERIYGITAAQAIGADISQLLNLHYIGTTRAQVRDAISSKGQWRGEMMFTRPTDGKKIILLASFKKLYDEAQQHIGYLVCGTDITERKEDELKLKEMEHRFRSVADAAPVGIWMSDTANRLTYVNKPLLDFAGLDAEAFTNATWAALVHPDDVLKTKETFKRHFWQKKPVTLIYRLMKVTGEYRWVQDTGTPRFLQDGTFLGYIGSIIDITDSKKREEQLQYQAWVLENVQDVVITTDLNYVVSSCNKAAEKLYGLTREQAVGRPIKDLAPLTLVTATKKAALQELDEKGTWKGEAVYIDAQGEEHYYLFTVSYFVDDNNMRTGILAVGRDITDRKRAAKKLEQSELFYRNLIAGSLDGIFLCNTEGTITFVSPSIKKILGFDAEEGIGKSCFEFVHPDDIGWAIQAFQNEKERTPEVKSIVIRLRKKDGSWLWCMVRGNNLLDNPHVKGMVIYFHDDTQRKEASQALKESEKRFRNLVGDLQVGVLLYSADGKTIMCNRAMSQMTMISEEELIGKNIYDVMSDDFIDEDGVYMPKEARPLSRVIATKAVIKDVVLGFRQRGTNERIWVLINADPILNEKGDILHIICTIKEITDRKRLEQELLERQISHQKALTQATIDGQEKERREIGKELHDNIGQQLTTTKLMLDMAKTTADDGTAEMVSLALKGISDVINEIRSISHALVPPILGDIGIIESIEALVESIRYVQLLKIEFDYFDFNEDRVPENVQLMLYRIIQEGMNNIIKHADATHVSIIIKNKNKQLMLELKDNGKGFKADKARRGLGLTNIKNRAELFGGNASIESTPGGGCSLKVLIPDAGPAAVI